MRGIAQHRQRRSSLGGLAGKHSGDRRALSAGEIQSGGGLLRHFVLQFQNDPLGDLFADALGRRQGLGVLRDDGHGQTLRRVGGKDGQCRLGPHAGHPQQQLEAVQLVLGGKAVQVEYALPHVQVGVEFLLFPLFQLGEGVVGGHAGIAHAAAVDDGQPRQDLRHSAVQIVKHTVFSLYSFLLRLDLREP